MHKLYHVVGSMNGIPVNYYVLADSKVNAVCAFFREANRQGYLDFAEWHSVIPLENFIQ